MFSFLKKYKKKLKPHCAALVAAAGSSSRMGGVNKLLEELDGIPVLARTLMALQRAEKVDEIIIATREDDLVPISQLCKAYGISKCTKVVRGGATRAHSVLLAAVEASPDTDLLAVQDGARPLVTPELIDAVIAAARRCSAAAPAVAVKDTVKTVGADGAVKNTPDRSALRAVQTPQVFDAELLRAALKSAIDQDLPITDDCSAVELMGKTVYLVDGEETNIKITTPTDLIIASALLRNKGEQI
jgi:2-C-methyl-D-erythritol 4-phosphate cytidylyltransferase